ncbi:response regulator [Pseudomonas sp. R81]|uniref:response regulator n=1 Tax=Pseudomonas sp. R81 TaxID=1144885 RepID=UPI00029A41B1|nr:response regulator [Pseudomonas sp. R81]
MVRIGHADISIERREAFLNGTPVPLGCKAFDVLNALLTSPNRLLTKQELLDTVWPDTFVEENNLQVHVSSLRRLLKIDREVLETVPRRGYRLNVTLPPQVAITTVEPTDVRAEGDQPTIYIVDDEISVRRALVSQLSSMGLRVEAYERADAFLENCRFSEPGCILLDMNLKRSSGLDLQAELQRRAAPFPIVFITGSGTIDLTVRAMRAGAQSLLVKPFGEQELMECVGEALAQAQRRFAEAQKAGQARARFSSLTSREREIFTALLTGAPNKQIANTFSLSDVTVKVHKKSIMTKLATNSMMELFHFGRLLAGVGGAGDSRIAIT